jgi:hypothetical protein
MKKVLTVLLIGAIIASGTIALAEETKFGEDHLWWEDYIVYYSVRAESFEIQIRRQPNIKESGEFIQILFDQSFIYADKNTRDVLAVIIPYADADGSNKRALCAIAAIEYTFEVDNQYDINLVNSPRIRARDFLSELVKEKEYSSLYYNYTLNNNDTILVLKNGYGESIQEALKDAF